MLNEATACLASVSDGRPFRCLVFSAGSTCFPDGAGDEGDIQGSLTRSRMAAMELLALTLGPAKLHDPLR